jgi:indole-3-glycerol phosphate synthase
VSDFLEQVIRERRADVAAARAAVSDDEMSARARVGPLRPFDQFHQALRHRRSGLAVIAEV